MKLKDYLDSLEGGQVSVGAKESYFFIGEVDELKARLAEINEAIITSLDARILANEAKLKRMKEYRANYTPIEDREVLDFGRRLADAGTRVKIEGQEKGHLWTSKEK